jgi:hypothetical protein
MATGVTPLALNSARCFWRDAKYRLQNGAPLATVEGDGDEPSGEESLAGDSLSKDVRQVEFWEANTDLNGGFWSHDCVKALSYTDAQIRRGRYTNLDQKGLDA